MSMIFLFCLLTAVLFSGSSGKRLKPDLDEQKWKDNAVNFAKQTYTEIEKMDNGKNSACLKPKLETVDTLGNGITAKFEDCYEKNAKDPDVENFSVIETAVYKIRICYVQTEESFHKNVDKQKSEARFCK